MPSSNEVYCVLSITSASISLLFLFDLKFPPNFGSRWKVPTLSIASKLLQMCYSCRDYWVLFVWWNHDSFIKFIGCSPCKTLCNNALRTTWLIVQYEQSPTTNFETIQRSRKCFIQRGKVEECARELCKGHRCIVHQHFTTRYKRNCFVVCNQKYHKSEAGKS